MIELTVNDSFFIIYDFDNFSEIEKFIKDMKLKKDNYRIDKKHKELIIFKKIIK